MTSNWNRRSIRCHNEFNKIGPGVKFAYHLLKSETNASNKWYTQVRYGGIGPDGPLGWIYIEFHKPFKLNGFGIRSADDMP